MSKFIDLTGQKFGRLTVVRRDKNNNSGGARWLCECSCGNKSIVSGDKIKNGHTKSCGCIRKEKSRIKAIDLTGQKFGRLSVVSRAGSNDAGKATWNCVCDCGNKSVHNGKYLRIGRSKSCGCLKIDTITNNKYNCIPILERLEKYIDKSTGRWLWVGLKNKNGYGRVLYNKKQWSAHRLVYTLFIGEIPEKMCICHLNDERLDVTPSNLICETAMWNNNDKMNKNRQCRGEKNGNAKLTESEVIEIRNSSFNGIELAKKYNINEVTISNILTRKTWKHI